MPYPAADLYPAANVYPGVPVLAPVGMGELEGTATPQVEVSAAAVSVEGRAGATFVELTGGR